jgi:fermentation-respiration switch protein FrsA (DUF1100 family)
MDDKPPAALFLISPYTSTKGVLSTLSCCKCCKVKYALWPCLFKQHWNNKQTLENKRTCHLFIIHGGKDKIISSRHAERLYQGAKAKGDELNLETEYKFV